MVLSTASYGLVAPSVSSAAHQADLELLASARMAKSTDIVASRDPNRSSDITTPSTHQNLYRTAAVVLWTASCGLVAPSAPSAAHQADLGLLASAQMAKLTDIVASRDPNCSSDLTTPSTHQNLYRTASVVLCTASCALVAPFAPPAAHESAIWVAGRGPSRTAPRTGRTPVRFRNIALCNVALYARLPIVHPRAEQALYTRAARAARAALFTLLIYRRYLIS